MSKYTPGPWRIGGKEKRVIFAANGDVVARTAAYGEQSETPDAEAGNAALIAAAPALLAALECIVARWESDIVPPAEKLSACIAMSRAAIDKAKGAT